MRRFHAYQYLKILLESKPSFVLVNQLIINQTIMKKNKLTIALTVLGLFCVNLLLAQTTISGTVTDAETDAPIPGVNIVIQGTTEGTNTDFDGNFSFSTSQNAPFTIEVSSVSYFPID